ncbi:MBL fold metallo-hydrolase [Novosphingobium sp. Gsoil 351]|uniref:MBL fold metallo-hydrolase n=1 Tax=Novosphingobium sp. Gsoil 351 TaxID=2675225 RepID=UPI0012B50391|nr:MBL fold metallo-hydrolase [Novosphingobium sp. Gsoil 351]QGN55977.1 MBL fold metallo-hydrolase [Novosphingobium sp. Gsoil 351]
MRRGYRLLVGLVALLGATYYWLLIDNRPGSDPGPTIRIADLRRLASAIPGPRPDRVALEQVGQRRVPAALFVAGGGLERDLVSIQAGLISGPWGDVVVDSGFGPQDAAKMGVEGYAPANQARVDAAMRRARVIVFTHEHVDHEGGLLRLRDWAEVLPRALITPEQMPTGPVARLLPWPKGAAAAIRPLRYKEMTAIAPGVVLIRTPGHTPGSQMVYTRLVDGREVLFAGDTATMARSWEQLRARSRLIGDLIVHEDRAAVFGWLKAIRGLHRAAPDMTIIPGHEWATLIRDAQRNRLTFAFPGARPSPQSLTGQASDVSLKGRTDRRAPRAMSPATIGGKTATGATP